MDFIRKNWSRLSLAFLFFIGVVISIIAWVNNSNFDNVSWFSKFYQTVLLISTIVFFFGMVGVTVMKSIPNSKKIVSIVYMAMGAIVTVLLLVLIIVAGCNSDYTAMVLFYDDIFGLSALYQVWVPFFVFGLYPLIKGVTRFIEAESVPAQVTVQPTAQPVTETVAEAPKAPAKKAATKTPTAK
ncbi:MAG: hypothetical protein NC133_03110 [Prevotella sp.]|nr:hypothetical protein [Prevotella sp.]